MFVVFCIAFHEKFPCNCNGPGNDRVYHQQPEKMEFPDRVFIRLFYWPGFTHYDAGDQTIL